MAADGVPPGREEEKELVESGGAAEAGGQEDEKEGEEPKRLRLNVRRGRRSATVGTGWTCGPRPRETAAVRTASERKEGWMDGCWKAGMSNGQAERAVERLDSGPRFRSRQLRGAEIGDSRGGGRDTSSRLCCFSSREGKKKSRNSR